MQVSGLESGLGFEIIMIARSFSFEFFPFRDIRRNWSIPIIKERYSSEFCLCVFGYYVVDSCMVSLCAPMYVRLDLCMPPFLCSNHPDGHFEYLPVYKSPLSFVWEISGYEKLCLA
ncbi:hypothetical protein AVEN_180433-1 [Araneus ventricosus]|uniref:Uncharacterized protein n=1 Tax=Araneus ventricosus TaxID=182803 RepID=A0A4Y2MM16_ARAVE|nr:hypothetical protein AVEN_180433-1 [Araneus ventricosus]